MWHNNAPWNVISQKKTNQAVRRFDLSPKSQFFCFNLQSYMDFFQCTYNCNIIIPLIYPKINRKALLVCISQFPSTVIIGISKRLWNLKLPVLQLIFFHCAVLRRPNHNQVQTADAKKLLPVLSYHGIIFRLDLSQFSARFSLYLSITSSLHIWASIYLSGPYFPSSFQSCGIPYFSIMCNISS